jgi:lipopolysaccharide export system permease protein
MFNSTDRYIARLIAVPLTSTLVIAAMLLVLDKMLRLFDFVAAQGGPVSVVWRMLANMLPEYLSLGIPIGLMLGILLALRRLALSSELDVLRGVGMSPARLMRVPYMYAAALALVNLAIVGFIQPYSRYAYEGLSYELRSGALGASIKIGEFANLGKGMTLRIEESHDTGRDLRGIFVRIEQKPGQSLAVTAARGTFMATDDPDTIILRLTDGVLVQRSAKLASPRILSFSGHDLPIALPKIENFRSRGNADRELTLPELVRVGVADTTQPKTRSEVLANMNFRLAEVAMMFLLPLAALAFAIPPKRSTSALGVFLSIVFIVTYHKINQYAEALGSSGRVSPFLRYGCLSCCSRR